MTHGAGGGAVIALSRQAERKLVDALRRAGATSPDMAAEINAPKMIGAQALRRLIDRRVIGSAGDGRFWLNEDVLAQMTVKRGGKAGWIVIVILFALVIALGVLASRVDAQTPDQSRAAFRETYRELIETNTTLSEGDCTLAAQRMQARLIAAGFTAEDARVLVPADHPKFGALAAVMPGTDAAAPAVLLLAHIDVVEARRADWQRDPFTLIEEDGWFYARGAVDDKAQAAIWVDAFIRLKAEGFRPNRTLKLALTCGEETADTWNGVRWLLAEHPETLAAGFALNEGARGELDAEGNHRALNIQAGEKIYQDYALSLTNPGGHSARPRKDNAIAAMGRSLANLIDHDFALELTPVTRAYFAAMADTNPAQAADLRALAAPTPDPAAAARVSASHPIWNATMRTTCIPTLINGGHAPNAQPQSVTANVNCRILPGHTIAETQAEIARVLDNPAITIAPVGEPSPTAPAPPLGAGILGPITAAAAHTWPGVPVVPTLSTGATDGRFTNAAGVPTYGVTGLFGDPDGNGVHGLNERIRVRSLYEGRDFLFDLVKRYAMAR